MKFIDFLDLYKKELNSIKYSKTAFKETIRKMRDYSENHAYKK